MSLNTPVGIVNTFGLVTHYYICAVAHGTIKELGVCSDCEEAYEAEEDYRGRKQQTNSARMH